MSARPAMLALAGMVCVAFSAVAGGAELRDVDRGRMLYENHCVVCHTSKVHRRLPSSVIDREALRFIVKVWVDEQKLRWSPEDVEDVVHYLELSYYRLRQ